jgi:hypothetical protein
VEPACAQAGEILAFAPLDNGDVDSRQRQFACQHQPGWTSTSYNHRMLGHRHTPARIIPAASSCAGFIATRAMDSKSSRNTQVENITRI